MLIALQYAFRRLARAPVFAVSAVPALGIGANTAVFSVVDAVLLKPLPHEHPDRLVRLTWEPAYTRAGLRQGNGLRDLVGDRAGLAARRVDRVIRGRVERLAQRENRAQVRHRLRMVGHRPPIALPHDAVPVVLGPRAKPDRDGRLPQ